MQLSDELVRDIEIKYLQVLRSSLQDEEIDFNTAKSSAQEFLKMLPFRDHIDLKTKIQTFAERYPMLIELHVFVLKLEEQNQTENVLEKMRGLMKDNKIDEALYLAQQ